MPWEYTIALFVYGTVVGSFLNVCIYRLPLGKSIVYPGSGCPTCATKIAWYDNVPIVAWLWLRGRCRSCSQTISPIYPIIELIAGLLTLQVSYRFGLTWESLFLVLLGFAFLVLLAIDFYHYILPDVITLPGIVLGIAAAGVPFIGPPIADIETSLVGVVAGGGGLWGFAWIFEKITGKVGMGFGDVKLLAMIGAWLGWQALPFTLFFAGLTGSIVGITWIMLSDRDRSQAIPFGPYLVSGAWIYLFYGADVYEWYLP